MSYKEQQIFKAYEMKENVKYKLLCPIHGTPSRSHYIVETVDNVRCYSMIQYHYGIQYKYHPDRHLSKFIESDN